MSKKEQVYDILKFNEEDLKRKRKRGVALDDDDDDVKKKKRKFEDDEYFNKQLQLGDLKKGDVDGDKGEGVALNDSSSSFGFGLEDVKIDADFNKQGGYLDQGKGGAASNSFGVGIGVGVGSSSFGFGFGVGSSSFGFGVGVGSVFGFGVDDVKKRKGKFDEEEKWAVAVGFSKEEVQKMEVAAEEEEYPYKLSEEEEKYYRNPRDRSIRRIVMTDNPDEFSTKFHTMSDREYQIYTQVVRESEGFDIPFQPYALLPGKQAIMNLTRKSTAHYIAKLSKFAIICYNKKHDTDYALEHLVKAIVSPTSGLTYYITFKAKSVAHSDCIETFQAKVHRGLKGDIEVMLCRIKPC